MIIRIFNFFNKNIPGLSSSLRRSWYWYISKVDRKGDFVFLNYGYLGKKIKLKEDDEKERLQAQLYNHVASKVNLKDKRVLEVGSGRGGGTSYVARYLQPKSIEGVDLCKKSIEFCKKHYNSKNLLFKQGDALNLPFEKERFDAVINVESSHGYLDFDKFLSNAFRVLKKDGFLLFADFRYKKDIANLEKSIGNSGFKVISKEYITNNIVKALKKDNKRKNELIKKFIPKMFYDFAKHFSGVEGSEVYKSFINREREYLCFVLKKR